MMQQTHCSRHSTGKQSCERSVVRLGKMANRSALTRIARVTESGCSMRRERLWSPAVGLGIEPLQQVGAGSRPSPRSAGRYPGTLFLGTRTRNGARLETGPASAKTNVREPSDFLRIELEMVCLSQQLAPSGPGVLREADDAGRGKSCKRHRTM